MKPLVFTLSGLLFQSCAPTVQEVDTQAKTEARAVLPKKPLTWTQAQKRSGTVKTGWIDSFGDRTLTRLVKEAQANNPNIQEAAAKVQGAQALALQAGAALSPQLGFGTGAGGGGAGSGSATGNLDIGLQASWELDLWGKLRSGQQAANAGAEAVIAEYRFSRYSLAGAVARAYFLAIDASRQAELASQNLAALAENERIVAARRAVGEEDRGDLSLVRSDVANAKAALAAAEGSQRDSLRALELLLGRYPGADLKVRQGLPAVPSPPPAGLPSDLLERRPDLIAAERRIASAINNVNQSKAARLPSISLTASGGAASSALNTLTNPSNLAWQAASSLLVPIVDGGARKAQIKVDEADQRAAVASYAGAALRAFGDVEKALDQGTVIRNRRELVTTALREANVALDVAEKNYKAGEKDLFEVLQLRQKSNSLEASKIALERAELDQNIALNLALGGSWK